jgi:hypothetical protein
MRLIWILILTLSSLWVTPSLGQEVTTRQFFDSAQVRNMKLSPDAKHVAFTFEEGSEVKLGITHGSSTSDGFWFRR